jgi:hypothetical protein
MKDLVADFRSNGLWLPGYYCDASSLPEAAGDAALMVDVNNEKALEEAMIALAMIKI